MQNVSIVVLAGYKDLFGGKYKTALEKINNYPLQVVLLELVGINYTLRGNSDLYSNISVQVQESLFRKWLGEDKYVLSLYDKLNAYSRSVKNRQVIVFNRASCLFGIDYCYRNLKSTDSTEEKFVYTRGFWIDLIEFCLACNEVVTQYENIDDSSKVSLLEHVNAKQALLNELKTISNPFLVFNRYISLISYLEEHDDYKGHLNDYLKSLGLNPKTFIKSLILLYFNKGQKKNLKFFIHLDKKESQDAYALLEWLSDIKLLPKKHDLDLLSIYKWPVFKYSDEQFAMLDVELLLDKLYRQFINDFYFDFLKKKGITYQDFRSVVGGFFEDHVVNELSQVFDTNPKISYRHTSQLLFGNPKKELCDLYTRHKKNIFIGQVKSTNFTDDQKFQGTFEFYKGDMDRFYKDVGVSQLIQTIEWMTQNETEIDSRFHKKTRIFPAIILNDKYFETPVMPQVLANEFKERLSKVKHDFMIHDLIVMDVSSVERLKAQSMKKGKVFWKILWKNKAFGIAPHFNNTLDFLNIKFHRRKEMRKLVNYLDLRRE